MKYKSAFIAVLLLLGVLLVGCTGNESESVVLRIGAQPNPLYTSVFLARELGYLEEELSAVGATYEWTEFPGGPLVNEAVAAGTKDIGFMAVQPAVVARSAGLPVQIISNVGYGPEALALMVAVDSDITGVEDLAGKTVALVVGSYAQHLLILLLEDAGLSTDDINLVNMPAGEQPAALSEGHVDAIVIWEQFISQLVTSGAARVVADGTGLKRGNLVTYAVESFAQENPLVIQAYIRAIGRASDYIADNPQAAAEAVHRHFGLSQELMEEVLTRLSFDPQLAAADMGEISMVAEHLYASGVIANEVRVGEFVNTAYLEAIFN